MALLQIVLRLAGNPGFSYGDSTQGHVVIVPLDHDKCLNAGARRRKRRACRMIQFKLGEETTADRWLWQNGSRWFFHCDDPREGADEPGYRLREHRWIPGAYVTVDEGENCAVTDRITQVQPCHIPRQPCR